MRYEDIAWLWTASRRAGSDLSPEEFTETYEPWLAQYEELAILEDENKEFRKAGKGPIGVVTTLIDGGWVFMPHVHWFPWATNRNILRCTVAYLASRAYSRKVGAIKIQCHEKYAPWFTKLRRYLEINRVGVVPYGRPDGDEYIFSIKGKKNGSNRKRVGQSDASLVRRRSDGERARVRSSPQSASDTA